jgi:predicted nucleotidyltransferase component of viral defense system
VEKRFVKQVELLLRIAPEIRKFEEFALHGDTAINLFYHNMPRLSVDIDLTYIPIENRIKDLRNISILLKNLAEIIQHNIPAIQIHFKKTDNNEEKLFCRLNNVEVKIEVNTINRGINGKPEKHLLCNAAQEEFNSFFEMQLVPEGQLFGGKIVAALDRQHPRDLFDTMQMLNNTGLTDQIMIGFLFCLFSSKRPFDELLNPNPLNQANIIENHFKGMTKVPFNNNIYEAERKRLIQAVNNKLSINQKEMIMSIAKGEPNWLYKDWSMYPGIAWKQKNIGILKKRNYEKFKTQINNLKNILA